MSEYTLTPEERIGYVARAAAAYGYSKGKWGNDISAGVGDLIAKEGAQMRA